eukprot:3646998-Rhodomonas_salina.1
MSGCGPTEHDVDLCPRVGSGTNTLSLAPRRILAASLAHLSAIGSNQRRTRWSHSPPPNLHPAAAIQENRARS